MFSRQVAIGLYFADFCCRDAKLVIEIERTRPQKNWPAINRHTAWLEAQDYRVIRFRNEELMGDLDAMLERIQLSPDGGPSPSHLRYDQMLALDP